MKRVMFVAGFCLLLSFEATGATSWQIRKSVESSMIVTGSITVAQDGSVRDYNLDQQNKLPSAVVNIIGKTLRVWEFQPILLDGKRVLANAKMTLRIVAKPLGNGDYSVSVGGASFGSDDPSNDPSYKWTSLPHYPIDAPYVGCIVYLMALVNRQGRIAKIDVQQVDLRFVADSSEMEGYRKEFGAAALRAVRDWQFNIPQASEAKKNYWVVEIPINFAPLGSISPKYGEWDAYVPGPVKQIPWLQSRGETTNGSADAVSGGAPFVKDARFVLKTPATGVGRS